ncbi:amidase [Streptomyces sp. NBC_00829]|uniref:amidase n=1 Tax=Streptomyces sp. NBC_00829 TaxID=2903679 RepID=UPI0038660661|nr:amidase [Streptomyces sp. NBC_00829]
MAADSAVWREHGTPLVAGSDSGPLHGVRLAVKDVHAVEGHRLGAGNPEWLAEAQPQKAHSWAVRALLDAGADVTGIARSDEFAYSLDGTNAHYGTPPNPAAPGRVPGGSSSGPASAVALGEADAGLGSDTAGSIRVPSSYCGLYGLRPTHGLVPVTGMLPLAPSFDTVAWLARDAVTLARVGEVLLPAAPAEQQRPFHTALVAADLVALAEPEVRDAFGQAAAGLAERLDLRIEEVPTLGGDPAARAEAFASAQGAEVWECDGDWVSAHPGTLGPGVERRFARAASVTQEERAAAEDVVHRTARDLRAALPEDTVLLLPATCGPAPLTDEGPEHKDAGRQATFRLTCLASGAGLPCLVLPRMVVDGLPVGLAVIAGPGTDHALLELAVLSGA